MLAVERSAESIARHATGPVVVVEKSTAPAGSAERLEKILERNNDSASFLVVSNPEFLREGSAVEDSLNPGRILVGSDSAEALEIMRRLYEPLIDSGVTWITTDLRTAELAKHACNAFLALKISYINALARLCERAGADVEAVADVMGADPRIGRAFLNAGLGYGGSCFPKDLAAFERLAVRLGYDFPILREIKRINEEVLEAVFAKVEDAMWNLEEKRVALLGLAFKPGTDDVRFAPALALAGRLINAGALVIGYDPVVGANAKDEMPKLALVNDVYEALEGAHCAVLCTEWNEFLSLDLALAKEKMASPILIDGRNFLNSDSAIEAGLTYIGMGRPLI